jgi:hypothetical protein
MKKKQFKFKKESIIQIINSYKTVSKVESKMKILLK